MLIRISTNVTPESIRPFRKSPPKKRRAGIKKGKTRTLTDTPEKIQIAAQSRKNGRQCRQKSN